MINRCRFLRRIHTKWRHLLHPLPNSVRKYEWFKRDAAEANEATLRRPYYVLKSVEPEVRAEYTLNHPEDSDYEPYTRIVNPLEVDDMRRATLVAPGQPGPMPESEDIAASLHSEDPAGQKEIRRIADRWAGYNATRHKYYHYYPRYPHTFEAVPPHVQ